MGEITWLILAAMTGRTSAGGNRPEGKMERTIRMEINLTTKPTRRGRLPGDGLTARRRALQTALVRAERRGDLAQVWQLLAAIRDLDVWRWRLATGGGRRHNRRIAR